MKGLLARCCSQAAVLVCLLALALGLRLANAAFASLKLDDFHSLHHARAADMREFFAVLVRDNHPPLSFLLVRGARALLGEAPWVLRLPALACGLATFLLVWRLGARLPCRAGAALAALLVAASTLHVEISSDVRMYALLGLASAGMLEGLIARLEDGRGALRVALWTVVGLHAHYHFLYALCVLGSAALALTLARPAYRHALRPTLAAFALAGLAALPWYVWGFPAQLEHGLAPGGSNATLPRLVEGFKNLVFLNVSVGGGTLRAVGLAASAVLLLLAPLAAFGFVWRARATGRPATAVLLLASAFAVPLLTWAAASLSTRAGYEWRYLAGALPAFCLVVGAEACAEGRLARLRRAAALALGPCALLVALANARDPGDEDYRDAVATIVARASPEDAVVVADWQPGLFPQGLAWDYYSARLGGGSARERIVLLADFALAERDSDELRRHARVFCCLRSMPRQTKVLLFLRRTFPREEVLAFGRSVFVHVFTRAEGGD